MINFINVIKALVLSVVTSGIYNLYASTSSYQALLAKEGQEVGKIEALMHYSTLTDVWSRMLDGWLHLFIICFISCVLFLLILKSPDESK